MSNRKVLHSYENMADYLCDCYHEVKRVYESHFFSLSAAECCVGCIMHHPYSVGRGSCVHGGVYFEP